MKTPDWAFLFGCIPFRIALAYAAYQLVEKPSSSWLRRVLIAFTAIVGLGFLVYYTRGPAGFGATPEHVWWHQYRPLHALNYLMFTISAIYRLPYASAWLIWDVVLGLILYGQHKVVGK